MTVVLRPGSLAQAQQQMRQAARDGLRLLIRGAGTGTDWGGAVTADASFHTTGLDRLLHHRATDLTVAVEAGMPLRTLQTRLADHGQRVAFDAARVDAGATIGGLIATADAGPSVLGYGTLRDQVIGATLLLADGTLARTGGHVIKNVAGYDLAKLVHGSLGTLAVITEVVLRLQPLPAATATLRIECAADDGYRLAEQLLQQALEPVALEWCDGLLLARFEGTVRGLAARGRQARRLAGDAAQWSDDDTDPAWRRVAEYPLGAPGDTVLRIGTRPAQFTWLAGRLDALAAQHGLLPRLRSSLGSGIHDVLIRGGDPGQHAAFLTELRSQVHEQGGLSTITRRGSGPAAELAAWPVPPVAVPVMRAVKQAFDPDGRLGSGRFAPWW